MNELKDNYELLTFYAKGAKYGMYDERGIDWWAFLVTYPDARQFPELTSRIGEFIVLFHNGDTTFSSRENLSALPGWKVEDSRLTVEAADGGR